MKSIILIVLGVAATLVVGFFIGRWETERTLDALWAKTMRPEVHRATGEFSHAAGLLTAIRSGDTNEAIETLEDDLDTKIMFIGSVTEATPLAQRDKQWLSRIKWLSNYRADHPRKTKFAGVDEQVAHYLTLVQTNK
jgi:hypothetical protein